MDFVLWKPSDDATPGWPSPWGRGRPGWHIECSAMARELLGDSFDIHGGGIDLQFPHHENEIAQSCCAHPEGSFARVWMHNEMLLVEGRKMSKSLGNFFTVRDLLDQGVPGEVIRFVLLSAHYRSPMDWTEEKARQAKETLHKWRSLSTAATEGGVVSQELVEALADDLNTAGAIAVLHRMAKEIEVQQRHDVPSEMIDNFAASARLLGLLDDDARMGGWVFGGLIDLVAFGQALATATMKLADLRAQAMTTKDFSAVDALKTALVAAGVEVRMSKAGVDLVPGPDFDPAKLERLL